jgi:hypothetical protein
MICFNEKCNKQFEKGLGVVEDDNWYCSEDCSNICEYRIMLKDNNHQEDEAHEEELEEEYLDENYYDPMNDF